MLHDAAWVLPATPYTVEQMQWLAREILELDGNATVWEAQICLAGQDTVLVQQFATQADDAYHEMRLDLDRPDADLAALSRCYRQVQAHDYFPSGLGEQVHQALEHARGYCT